MNIAKQIVNHFRPNGPHHRAVYYSRFGAWVRASFPALTKWVNPPTSGRNMAATAVDKTPEEKSRRAIDCCQQVGHRFRPGVEGAVTEAYRSGGRADVLAALDAFIIKPGVELPWGRTIVP